MPLAMRIMKMGPSPCGPPQLTAEGGTVGRRRERASQAWSGRARDAQLWCESLGASKRGGWCLPHPCPPGGDRELSPWQQGAAGTALLVGCVE